MTEIHPTAVRAPVRRLYALDTIRVAVTALVVLHHCAVTYSDIPVWYYVEPSHDRSSLVLDVFLVLNQAWFMGVFFLLAGFFTPGALDRKGPGRFVRGRLLRLGVPLLVFVLLLRPLLTIQGYRASGVSFWWYYAVSVDPGPTWFLEVLIVFSLVYALWRRRRPAPTVEQTTAPRPVAVAGFVVALAAVTALWRLAVPLGTYVPVLGLPSAAYLPQYAALFAVGVIAHRRGWYPTLPRRAGWIGLAVAVVAAVLLVASYLLPGGVAQDVLFAVLEAVLVVAAATAMVVLFRDHVDGHGPVARFLADNALAAYVLHPLIVVGLGYALAALVAPALAKFAVLGVLALPLTWALAAVVRAIPGVRRVL